MIPSFTPLGVFVKINDDVWVQRRRETLGRIRVKMCESGAGSSVENREPTRV